MNEIERYKNKKFSEKINIMANSVKSGGFVMAESCYDLAYKIKKMESQVETNRRNIKKLNS